MSADIQAVGDPVEAIRAALAAGPTPGPWSAMSRGSYWHEEEADVRDADGNDLDAAEFIKPPGDVFTTRGQVYMRDAAYMVACNPEAMAVVLARLDAAERASGDSVGYVDAFYELGALMGLSAQALPPAAVWKEQMLPRLKAALQAADARDPAARSIFVVNEAGAG